MYVKIGLLNPPPQLTFKDSVTGNTICPTAYVPSLAVATSVNAWAWTTVFCLTIYEAIDLSQAAQFGYAANCGGSLATSTACTVWKKQTCTDTFGGIYYDTSTLDVLAGCFLGACCVPIQVVNAGPVNNIQIDSAASGTLVEL